MMTIVLIHGLGQSFHIWDKVLPHLKTIHKHVCVDLLPFNSAEKRRFLFPFQKALL